jgi:hypothetical protein
VSNQQPLFDSARFDKVFRDLARPAIERIELRGTPVRASQTATDRVECEALLHGAAKVQALDLEPTTENLRGASALSKSQVERILHTFQLHHLPASVHLEAIERGEHAEPDAIYIKSYVEHARGPDKFGADSTISPNIPAAEALRLNTGLGVRHQRAATSSAYAISIADEMSFVIGHVPVVQGWWRPDNWTKYLHGSDITHKNVEEQLRAHADLGDWRVPLVSTPLQVTTELIDQCVHMRDGQDWDHVQLRDTAVGSGWLRTGCAADLSEGFGAHLDFIAEDLRSIDRIITSDFTPMLDLPQDPLALRGRGGWPLPKWNLDWEFLITGRSRTSDEIENDLTAIGPGGTPASEWWKPIEPATLRMFGIERSTRYRYLRCQVRAPGETRHRDLTLLARLSKGRWSGWVTTLDPTFDETLDAARQLLTIETQTTLICQAEADVRRHRRDGIVETTMTALLAHGWAQRNKRRKYSERMNFAALAMTARTLIDLARVL